MAILILTEDRAALPAALLPLAKTQMRVDTAADDAFIKSLLARAIARFQEENEVTVNPSTFTWTPAETDFSDSGAVTLPVRPVTLFTASILLDDVSADYAIALKWDGIYGVPIQQLFGPAVAGLSIALTAGYADLAALPDAVLDTLLRHTAFLYEYREITLPDQPYMTPDLERNATWWMPRV